MATSTLIQFLEAGEDAKTSHRREEETFIAGGTIAKGDWVVLDTSQSGADRALYVVEASGVATHGNSTCIGVALEGVSSGQQVRVVTAGYVAEANVAAATTADDPLVGPIGTAGRAEVFNPGTTEGRIVGIALDADTANVAPVMVCKVF